MTFLNSIPNWTTFAKEVSDAMFGFQSDEITVLWPNGSLTLIAYQTDQFLQKKTFDSMPS